MKLVLTALLLFGFAASAQTTVDKMTCAAAQEFAGKHGRYYVDGGPDGAIPIYPAFSLDKLNCSGRTLVRPEMRRTLDNPNCPVSWYCMSY